ncbi:MAG TPA: glycosyltransferase family 39 protein [Quisquiliibacterium sp.]|nr:glycosyltransferase family 39 protein [Quisquiliibacterium sp.]
MRPFLVTELQAGKLPRWGLILLCALYILPGFIGRDPWRHADAAGFGVALSMARGSAVDWLIPNIAGEPSTNAGPLPFWFGAAFARALPLLDEHSATLAAAMLGLVLLFVTLWYATYALARRPGVQPSDPFGASASRIDFGRVIADSALLVLLATLGVIARVHETTADAAQLVVCGLFTFGAARALERPVSGGLLAGLAIGASVMTRGLPPAAALMLTAIALPIVSRPYRLVAARWLATALPTGLLVGALWPAALALSGEAGRLHLEIWLAWHRSMVSAPSLGGALYLLRTLPWYFWPSWPMALWALLRWRGRLGEPAIALPLTSLAAMAVVSAIGANAAGSQLLPAALPLAMLAALGLPTLKRSVVSLIDWFAVMTFSLIGFVVWAYWIAFVTGYPPRMAFSASRIAPGFEPDWIIVDVTLGLLASAAWLALVRWRVSRQPPMIWRAVMLSSSGLVLAWFLLMTLWLPAFNERNTYRDVAQRAAKSLPEGYDCVGVRSLGAAQRATLYYFGRLRFGGPGERCGWLLVQDTGPLARTSPSPMPGWALHWEGSRLRDRDERLRLYRRID